MLRPERFTPADPPPRTTRRRPLPPHRSGSAGIAIALLLGLAAATVACGSDGPDEPSATLPTAPTTEPGTTTEPEATTTTAEPTVEQQVEAAYLAASAAYFDAAIEAGGPSEGLGRTRTGPSLAKAEELLRGFERDGIRVVLANGVRPLPTVRSVVLQGDDRATVTVCLVDDAHQVRVADGSIVDDSVLSRLDEADMRLTDEGWKLNSLKGLQRWPDAKGCDR